MHQDSSSDWSCQEGPYQVLSIIQMLHGQVEYFAGLQFASTRTLSPQVTVYGLTRSQMSTKNAWLDGVCCRCSMDSEIVHFSWALLSPVWILTVPLAFSFSSKTMMTVHFRSCLVCILDPDQCPPWIQHHGIVAIPSERNYHMLVLLELPLTDEKTAFCPQKGHLSLQFSVSIAIILSIDPKMT